MLLTGRLIDLAIGLGIGLVLARYIFIILEVKKLHCLSFTPFPCLMFCPSFLRF